MSRRYNKSKSIQQSFVLKVDRLLGLFSPCIPPSSSFLLSEVLTVQKEKKKKHVTLLMSKSCSLTPTTVLNVFIKLSHVVILKSWMFLLQVCQTCCPESIEQRYYHLEGIRHRGAYYKCIVESKTFDVFLSDYLV